ncbi:MAG: gluconate 2-dehydrogenase subunit 3 family protein [Gemmatimonadetes bacterium]|nr:gluconate 2-dehydrogenase subunit 3 family protein [Gemmatimonadota bacterium]
MTQLDEDDGGTAMDAGATSGEGAVNGVNRRDALKAIASAAAITMIGAEASAQGTPKPAAATAPAAQAPVQITRGPRGDAWDPDLIHPKSDWPRKLTASELATLAALCDVIIPADAKSPSASSQGAHHYINEHVSAPGAGYERDLVRVRGGVSWLNVESERRFAKTFVKLSASQKTTICDDICYAPKAKEEFKAGARFFSLVRNLTATAYYTTDAGMKDVGYVGNVASMKWELPPKAVLDKLGL